MMKRLTAFILVLIMLVPSAIAEEKTITKEILLLVEKATKDLDCFSFEQVYYLENLCTAGTNYAILCNATPNFPESRPTRIVLYLFEDLNGNVSITNIAYSL